MEIKFRAENGLCPYYIYKDTKFFIQDSKKSDGYTYSLHLKHLKVKIEVFEDNEAAIDYINEIKGIRFLGSFSDGHLYTDISRYYSVKGNKVIIRPTDAPISGSFDSYADCLNFAKKYVADFIREQEPEQLSLI